VIHRLLTPACGAGEPHHVAAPTHASVFSEIEGGVASERPSRFAEVAEKVAASAYVIYVDWAMMPHTSTKIQARKTAP
jgi:hypothetical protein